LSGAARTVVAFDAEVDFGVLEQVGLLGEAVGAPLVLTLVGFLVRMNSKMVKKVVPFYKDSITALVSADHGLVVLPAQLARLKLVDHELLGLGNVLGDADDLQLEVSPLVHDHIFDRLVFRTLGLNVEVVSGLNLVWLHELEFAGDAGLEQLYEEPIGLYSAYDVGIEKVGEVWSLILEFELGR
jgi:hypothetical protein